MDFQQLEKLKTKQPESRPSYQQEDQADMDISLPSSPLDRITTAQAAENLSRMQEQKKEERRQHRRRRQRLVAPIPEGLQSPQLKKIDSPVIPPDLSLNWIELDSNIKQPLTESK